MELDWKHFIVLYLHLSRHDVSKCHGRREPTRRLRFKEPIFCSPRNKCWSAAALVNICSWDSRSLTPYTWAEKFESFERINSIRETKGNFDSCNSCKRLGTSRLHELHESKFPFVSRIEFIRSKLSNFSAHVYGVAVLSDGRAACTASNHSDQ